MRSRLFISQRRPVASGDFRRLPGDASGSLRGVADVPSGLRLPQSRMPRSPVTCGILGGVRLFYLPCASGGFRRLPDACAGLRHLFSRNSGPHPRQKGHIRLPRPISQYLYRQRHSGYESPPGAFIPPPTPQFKMREYDKHQSAAIAFSDDTTLRTGGTEESYPKLLAPGHASKYYKPPLNWAKVAISVRQRDAEIRELNKITPRNYRGVKFSKTATLLGQKITLGRTTTAAVQERINKAMGAWRTIKRRACLDPEFKTNIRLQLWNTAIYSILKYVLIALKISESAAIKIRQFTSKCVRDIGEAENKNA